MALACPSLAPDIKGDGGAGAPVLLEHRVSPGARLLTLVGHYGVTSERSELFIIHYPYLPDNQRQVMPVEGPSQVEGRQQQFVAKPGGSAESYRDEPNPRRRRAFTHAQAKA